VKLLMHFQTWLLLSLALSSHAVLAADMVSAFKGSASLGTYNADFVQYYYAQANGELLEVSAVEGSINSRLYRKPEDKNSVELLRSFERELTGGGFDVLASVDRSHRIELLARDFHGAQKNAFLQRRYVQAGKAASSTVLARVSTQAQQYLAARRLVQGTEVLVSVTIGRDGSYVIDQVTSAAMETGTVTLDLDALQKNMEADGRMAIYGIQFDTGSASIKPQSAATIDIILAYLKNNPEKHFYVVGHTDDTGALERNMSLSLARAEAVVTALEAGLPDVAQRLRARGVGPLSPVSVNTVDTGRELNRRVELVEALAGR
jgi:OmpA-OmpF porin, OOP family